MNLKENFNPSKVWFEPEKRERKRYKNYNFNPSKVWFERYSAKEFLEIIALFQSLKGLIWTKMVVHDRVDLNIFQSLKGLIWTTTTGRLESTYG